MLHWQLLVFVGILFLIVELFTPALFFLNFAIACFITAIVAFYIVDWSVLVPIFVILSAILLLFLRPVLIRKKNNGQKTGVEEKYLGKKAKVIEKITSNSGVVSLYDERWNARSESGEEVEVGAEVKIIRNESLMLYVEK